jgi:hypothetical protein
VNTVAKVARAVRLTPETVERVEALAKSLSVSQQVVLESAVEDYLDSAGRGTPDVAQEQAAPRSTPNPSPAFADAKGTRQQRLNAAMLRARARS